MHRDTKLGLALGILLVGIVGAFFFRNERTPHAALPALLDPHSLDEQIAEKPVTPYLMAPEFGETANRQTLANPVSALQANDAWEVPDFLKDDAGQVPSGRERGLPGPPDPILTSLSHSDPIVVQQNRITDLSVIPVPDHNRAWESSSANSAPVPGASLPVAVDGTTEYKVQSGDTLSGLAARHLGSSARFGEIFAVNRDVLSSPNGLRTGMTIRLPVARSAVSTAAPTGPAGPVPQDSTSTEAAPTEATVIVPEMMISLPGVANPTVETPAESATPPSADALESSDERPRLFQPVRRPPLSPRGAARPVQRLTQTLPEQSVADPVQP